MILYLSIAIENSRTGGQYYVNLIKECCVFGIFEESLYRVAQKRLEHT